MGALKNVTYYCKNNQLNYDTKIVSASIINPFMKLLNFLTLVSSAGIVSKIYYMYLITSTKFGRMSG